MHVTIEYIVGMYLKITEKIIDRNQAVALLWFIAVNWCESRQLSDQFYSLPISNPHPIFIFNPN